MLTAAPWGTALKFASPLLIAAILLGASPTVAFAGETACWLDRGVLVVPALVAGIPGDYILDTGSPKSQLHLDRAKGQGYDQPTVTGDVKLAGVTLRDRSLSIVPLDARTYAFPTPIAGVLGADVLDGLVLDVRWAPSCRVSLHRPGKAPRRRALAQLPLGRIDGRVSAAARATDGSRIAQGDFVLATGAVRALTLNQALSQTVPTAGRPPPMHLRAISFAGDLTENASTEVTKDGPEAMLGAPVLRGHPLRFDLARNRLSILAGQQKGPPAQTDGP